MPNSVDEDRYLLLQKKSIEKNRELGKIISEQEKQIYDLENKLDKSLKNEEEIQAIIKNLNKLVKNVFYVYGFNGSQEVFGTGFTITYKGKSYFVTAGHIVDGNCGYHNRLGFKQNLTKDWHYPKILCYKNDYKNDYAIFEGRGIYTSFEVDTGDSAGYIMGNLELNDNIIKSSYSSIALGESGSPIINNSGKVTAFRITAWKNTDIDKIIEAINDIEEN